MQRLFSTFARGWPGAGLLLQRTLTAILVIRFSFVHLTGASALSAMIPYVVCVFTAILLFVGLWTPVMGALMAVIELWNAVAHLADPWISVVAATLAITIAMIGPGAWSIDARLFGRKHIQP